MYQSIQPSTTLNSSADRRRQKIYRVFLRWLVGVQNVDHSSDFKWVLALTRKSSLTWEFLQYFSIKTESIHIGTFSELNSDIVREVCIALIHVIVEAASQRYFNHESCSSCWSRRGKLHKCSTSLYLFNFYCVSTTSLILKSKHNQPWWCETCIHCMRTIDDCCMHVCTRLADGRCRWILISPKTETRYNP